ncbi:hypothetical protein ACCUM_2508 [Candidatus Accumulibacter phosphatis]|uniref:Uncharacterized protein n=1 Tax=Candidatus Accumulibacter phosphatis TaxID=327160 RepID=A0A5S4ERF1_9PROT|nr:hypothetical protein ACCUM_2508 [Candidatus Accumulibacter phosphatis]
MDLPLPQVVCYCFVNALHNGPADLAKRFGASGKVNRQWLFQLTT